MTENITINEYLDNDDRWIERSVGKDDVLALVRLRKSEYRKENIFGVVLRKAGGEPFYPEIYALDVESEKDFPWIDDFIEVGSQDSQYMTLVARNIPGLPDIRRHWTRSEWVWLNRNQIDYKETARRRIGNGSKYDVFMDDGTVIRVTTVPSLKKNVDKVLLRERENTDRGVCTLGKEKYQVRSVKAVEKREAEGYAFLRIDVDVNGSIKEFQFIEDGKKFDWTKWLWKRNLSSFKVSEDGTRAVPE